MLAEDIETLTVLVCTYANSLVDYIWTFAG